MSEEDTLRHLLRPLPPLSFFQETPSRDADEQNFGFSAKTSSKQRKQSTCSPQSLPLQVGSAAEDSQTNTPHDVLMVVEAIRRAGAPADTIFFPSLPESLSTESGLRAVISTPVRSLKILRSGKQQKSAKTLAWAAFYNEADCVAALVRLRNGLPDLMVSLHKPKAGGGVSGPSHSPSSSQKPPVREQLDARADKIVADGGLCDTIMLRGLPLEVSVEELVDRISAINERCSPLRARTSESRDGRTRNFWLSYATRLSASGAFEALHGAQVDFRCGTNQRLAPVLHNDATDAETKKRRSRELAQGLHVSRTELVKKRGIASIARDTTFNKENMTISTASPAYPGLAKLESLLRSDSKTFYFLSS